MKVFIDHTKCEGTGYCVRIREDIFDLRDGQAVLRTEQGDRLLDAAADDLRDAENLCPSGAISVVD
jgi:ferredoxin